jgi:hypothetical protein
MIYFKILFTLAFIAIIVSIFASLIMINDDKRRELWFRIASTCWGVSVGMLGVGLLTAIWFFFD